MSEGIYSVAVIDENGCEPINEIQNIILTTPTSISVDFNSSIEVDCENNIITQTNFIFIDGGQPPYEITWSGGGSDPLNPNVMETSVEGNYSAFVNDQGVNDALQCVLVHIRDVRLIDNIALN